MIQLANDPNAARMNAQPSADGKAHGFAQQRRNGHAWPFLSRHAGQPASPNTAKTPTATAASR